MGIAFAMPSVAPPEENQVDNLTRPIMGIENRTPLEVFDIMVDRIKSAQAPAAPLDPISLLATLIASAAAEKDHPRFIAGYMAGLTDARLERQDARSLANVDVFDRRKAMGKPESEPAEYQADIIVDGRDHHGIGATPAEALLNAARHWYKHSET